METSTLFSYPTFWLFTVILVLLSWHYCRWQKLNPPPGPKPWPIIGNIHLIGSLPHHSIHALSQKYGPIMQFKLGSFPVIVASSPEIAETFLKTHDLTFSDRPKTAAGKYFGYNYSNITWAPYGPYWRLTRKLCLTELFSAKRIDEYEYIRVEEMKIFLKDLYMSNGKPVKVKDHLANMNLNVISRMVLGKNYAVKKGNEDAIVTPEEFKEMLHELSLLNGVLDIGDSIPWIAFLDLQGYRKRMKALAKKLERFFEHVLDEHNARRRDDKNWVPKDMVDVLLQLADDPNLDIKLERHGIKGFAQNLIAGGTESSMTTVEWAISEILKNPKVFKIATKELDRVIGRERWVEEKDMVNLPYIYAIVKETMRLHPIAPLLPRCTREDIQINGYDIQKGARTFVNVWTIGRDPKVWDKPNEFIPERFIGNPIDVKGHDYELLPFGAGRRMCPGYSLGLKVIQATLSNMLHGFKWKLPGDMKEEDLSMEEIFGLATPRKYPLHAVAEPRLPPHVYPQ